MLEGKQVFLRPVEEIDLPLLVRWRNAKENWRFFFNKFPLSISGQLEWYRRLNADKAKLIFVICLKDGRPIGTIGLDHIDFCNQSAEFGNFLIGENEFRSKGFAIESLELLFNYSFKCLNLNRLYLEMYESNAHARAIYESCGFKEEGLLREARFSDGRFMNVLILGLLRNEYLSGR